VGHVAGDDFVFIVPVERVDDLCQQVVDAFDRVIPLYYDFQDVPLLHWNLLNTYWALILPQIGQSVAFGTFWMRAFFRSVPPELADAARVDGASSWRILWRVLVPIGRPAILTMVLLVFMWTWNEFLLALVMISDESHRTAPLGLSAVRGCA